MLKALMRLLFQAASLAWSLRLRLPLQPRWMQGGRLP